MTVQQWLKASLATAVVIFLAACSSDESERESAETCLATCEPKLISCSLDQQATDAACALICSNGLGGDQKACLNSAECSVILDAINTQAEFCGITALVPGSSDDSDGSDALDSTDSGTGGEPAYEKCDVSSDCEPDRICDCIGRCVPPGLPEIATCSEDKNCGSGNYCDVCAGVCRVKKSLCESCESANECTDDGACQDFAAGGRYCLRGCVSDIGCPQPGFSCRTLPGAEFSQCVPDDGVCVEPVACTLDTECELGTICEQGQCRPGCMGDDVCPNGTVCQLFRCVAACSESAPCPLGQECAADGHCRIPGGCVQPADCPEPETFCDLSTNMCSPGCQADFDCKSSGKECIAGACEDKGCAANYFCAFGEVCALSSGLCEQAEGPHCEAGCDAQSASACGGQPNRCLELQDQDGNSQGSFCFVACGPDPSNPCPQGYACQELTNQDGQVESELCFRDCTNTPLSRQR